MKKLVILTIALFMLLSFSNCTKNQRAKKWGGNASIELEHGQKLLTVTWKDDNLWYLTREMKANETPDTYTFTEESSFGVMEGSYTITEVKRKK